MVTDVAAETVLVVMGNDALLETPPGIGTVAGTETAPLLLDKFTTIPPEGALPFRNMYPVTVAPPMTEVGETEI
jgi:hypothetical protein